MKLLLTLLCLSSLSISAHQVQNAPLWFIDKIESVVEDETVTAPQRADYKLIPYRGEAIDASFKGDPDIVVAKSSLVNTKKIRVYDAYMGHEWTCVVGQFECVYPNTNSKFKVWTLLTGIEPEGNARDFVKSPKWKGITLVKAKKKGEYLLTNVVDVNSPIENKDNDVYLTHSSYLSLDESNAPKHALLPYSSSLKKKNVNGFYQSWVPFSDRYLVTTAKTMANSGYGDRVTHVRYFFYDVTLGNVSVFPIVFDVATMAKMEPIRVGSEKIAAVTEVLENPIKVCKLKNDSLALKLFLPASKERKAGAYLLTLE